MTSSNPFHWQRADELAALVASGGASEAEERELQDLIEREPTVAELRRDYDEAASLLAQALEGDAVQGVVEKVQARVAQERRGGKVVAIEGARRRQGSGGRRAMAVVTAASLAAAAALALLWWRERDAKTAMVAKLQLASEQVALAERSALEAKGELERKTREAGHMAAMMNTVAVPKLQLLSMTREEGGAVNILMDPEGHRLLVLAFELPPVAEKDYQLWFVPEQGKPISAGILRPTGMGALAVMPAMPPSMGPVKPAISLEPTGGSAQPTADQILMVGDVL